MEILAFRPAPPGGDKTLARFDVQMDGMRLYNLSLKRTGAGLRVFAPSAFGSAAATFSHDTSAALIALAIGEIARHEQRPS